jgi:hypothetical protein
VEKKNHEKVVEEVNRDKTVHVGPKEDSTIQRLTREESPSIPKPDDYSVLSSISLLFRFYFLILSLTPSLLLYGSPLRAELRNRNGVMNGHKDKG